MINCYECEFWVKPDTKGPIVDIESDPRKQDGICRALPPTVNIVAVPAMKPDLGVGGMKVGTELKVFSQWPQVKGDKGCGYGVPAMKQ